MKLSIKTKLMLYSLFVLLIAVCSAAMPELLGLGLMVSVAVAPLAVTETGFTDEQVKRYRVLSKKLDLTDEEESELEELNLLKAKSEEAERLTNALVAGLKKVGIGTTPAAPVIKLGAEPLDNPVFRFHTLLVGMKKKDPEIIAKAADPQNVATTADGGYLVPQITQPVILELIPTFGQARQFMNAFPMSGNETVIPKELVNPTAYWVTEGSQITDSKATLGTITMTPKKLAAIVTLTNEVLMDASINFGQYIINKIAQAFGTAEDAQFFAGTGSPMNGIFKSTNTFGGAVATSGLNVNTLSYVNMLNCIAGVDQNYLANAGWYFHRSILPIVAGMTDSQQRPLLEPAFGDLPMRILGFPVRLIENAPSATTANATASTPFIILGDLNNSLIGDVLGMTVSFSTDGVVDSTSLFENDLTGIKVIKRVAFNAGLTAKYSIIKTAAA
jgi:HK97 family phage major capsid protein